MTASGADGIEVFLQSDDCDTKELLEKLKTRLPVYMVPRNIHLLRHFPLNANGKYDRRALQLILEKESMAGNPTETSRADRIEPTGLEIDVVRDVGRARLTLLRCP